MQSPTRWAANLIVAIMVATAVWSVNGLVPSTPGEQPHRVPTSACTVHVQLQYAQCGRHG